MLTSIHLKDFKSFADETIEVAPLTLLVGANASGKSNFLDAIRFLQGLALGLSVADVLNGQIEGERLVWPGIRGGIKEAARGQADAFGIDTTWELADDVLTYELECKVAPEPRLKQEILHSKALSEVDKRFQFHEGVHSAAISLSRALQAAMRSAIFLEIMPSRMRNYVHQKIEHLGVHGENLSAVVHRLCQDSERKLDLIDWLSELCAPELKDIDFVKTELGDVMMVLVEKDGTRISARSLSDGTLRFLGELVAMLTAPAGSMLLMEELENGLHPTRANLLVQLLESATRQGKCQIIATTHSPLLLQALPGEILERAIVFGRHPDAPGTVMKRLGDLPHFSEIVERRGIEHLFTTRWLERAL